MSATANRTDAAARTLALLDELFDGYRRDFAVRLWDETERGPDAGEEARFTFVLKHEGALRAMLASPSRLQLSMAEAFLHGDLDVEGDLEAVFPARGLATDRPQVGAPRAAASGAAGARRFRRTAACAPAGAPRGSGAGATRRARLAQAVHYHYDLDPEFYGALPGQEARLHVRVLPLAGGRSRHRAGAEARLHLPEAAPSRGRAAARHRLRLGRARHARRGALRRRGSRSHAVASRRPRSRTSASGQPGSRTVAASRCATSGRYRARSTRSRASGCSST